MANKRFGLGILVMVLVIGMTVAGCDNSTNPSDDRNDALDRTTWNGSLIDEGETMNYVLTFNSPNFTMAITTGGQTDTLNGTYTISGNSVTLIGMEFTTIGTLSGNYLDFRDDGGPLFTRQ